MAPTPYKVRIGSRVIRQIAGWQLPDKLLAEVYLFLREILPSDPENNLHRESEPFDRSQGMTCSFTRRDHYVLGRDHHFIFHVFLSQDELALYVERGAYDQENTV